MGADNNGITRGAPRCCNHSTMTLGWWQCAPKWQDTDESKGRLGEKGISILGCSFSTLAVVSVVWFVKTEGLQLKYKTHIVTYSPKRRLHWCSTIHQLRSHCMETCFCKSEVKCDTTWLIICEIYASCYQQHCPSAEQVWPHKIPKWMTESIEYVFYLYFINFY